MRRRSSLPAAVLLALAAACSSPAGQEAEPTPTSGQPTDDGAAGVVVIGHRGAADVAPENTVPGFEVAVEAGADMIEIDVQLSADGVPFLFHDDTPERTTNVAEVFPERVDDPITSFTWDELQRLDAGSFFRDDFAGTRIPSLDDAALTVGPDVGVDIELKSPANSPGLPEAVADALATEPWAPLVDAGLVVVTSFDTGTTRAFADLRSDVPVFPIVGELDAAWVDGVSDHADGVVTDYRNLDADAFALAADAGLPVWVYTVDDAGSMRAQIEIGVEGLITDAPAVAVEVVSGS